MKKTLIEKILKARVYDVAKNTPLELAPNLSRRLNNQIYLKREDLQDVFSFKLRGAFNCMYHLSEEEKQYGVVTASAGNHAQGVAMSGTRLGIETTIVMPRTTPDIKIQSVKALGGHAVLEGDNYDEAYAHALMLVEQNKLTFVHPFDNLDVIAGQGTIGMEILRQHPDPIDAIFIPVGGGGLISGVGTYIKYLYPDTKIIGVEHEEAPSMYEALKQNKRITLKQVGGFADGAAVKQIGETPFILAKDIVDEMLVVSTDETCTAIKDMFEETRTILEPAGAMSLAGLKKHIAKENMSGQQLIAISSGANMNFDRLRHVTERSELGEYRESLVAVTIPEQPGSFIRFCKAISNRSITEFNYRYSDNQNARVFAGVKLTRGHEEKQELLQELKTAGYPALDLSDNEFAKIHLRFMVGGHAPQAEHEVLYRFRFPEKPGALLHFLTSLGQDWNISLFHYRNHGSDFGRVLVGIQIPPGERRSDFCKFLNKLGYEWIEETDNPAYKLFLV